MQLTVREEGEGLQEGCGLGSPKVYRAGAGGASTLRTPFPKLLTVLLTQQGLIHLGCAGAPSAFTDPLTALQTAC